MIIQPETRDIISYNQNKQVHSFDNRPAITTSLGHKMWFLNGELHREDDAAYQYKDTKEYYINGKQYSQLDFNKFLENNQNILIEHYLSIQFHKSKYEK
jgi:hypothetical protein